MITSKNGAKAMGKPIGTYITLEAQGLMDPDEGYHREVSHVIADQIRAIIPDSENEKSILVVGLGNIDVTADALGPEVVNNLLITRHMIIQFGKAAYEKEKVNKISAIIPGVMGKTGMESAEIVKGIVEETSPDVVVVIDALAARSTKRLNRTIQITNTGIHPGSGVGNHRDAMTQLAKENQEQKADTDKTDANTEFARALEKKQEYQWDYYASGETLIEDFYAIDSTTSVKGNKISLQNLLSPDMTLKQDNTKPQILIYHTHSQEGFVDSVPGDPATTIMGAGEKLSEILQEEYGYNVIHHTGEYDVETRDYAYSYALPEIEKLLEEQKSIEVVIDLHRDAAREGTKLVTEIDGKKTAKFMFFNGLSYTNKQGEIDYLKNSYIQENLAFSFQMQVLCNEYYPGVTRRIYLKGYRYNMHLRPKTLLVELGAQTNTREEIWNALPILADVLDKQLSGVDR